MAEYKTIWTSEAKNDLFDIYYYITYSLKEPKIAEKLMNKIRHKILILEFMPRFSKKIENNKYHNCRRMVIGNYIAIYTIDERNKKVYILRIIYGGSVY